MREIDQYSQALGEFRTEIRNLYGTQIQINGKLDKLIDSVSVINDKSNKAHFRLDDVEEDMVSKKDAMKAVILGGALTGGGVAGIWQAITKIFES